MAVQVIIHSHSNFHIRLEDLQVCLCNCHHSQKVNKIYIHDWSHFGYYNSYIFVKFEQHTDHVAAFRRTLILALVCLCQSGKNRETVTYNRLQMNVRLC